MKIMDEMIKKQSVNAGAVEGLLREGVIELNGDRGRRMRFGFVAAMEHEEHLYIVLTKISSRKRMNHELLLLRMIRKDGKIDDYEVVHDPSEATELIDQYIRLAVQALFEDAVQQDDIMEDDDDMQEEFDMEDESDEIVH